MHGFKNIIITTGDDDGIGPEVTAKALAPKKDIRFFLMRNSRFGKKNLSRIDNKFERRVFTSLAAAIKNANSSSSKASTLFDVCSDESPAQWVVEAARSCKVGDAGGMVTAPLSKNGIIKAGLSDIGHTEILSRIDKKNNLFMFFLGEKFNVLNITGHIPLKKVPSLLTQELISDALKCAYSLRSLLPPGRRQKPLALVGLNPHAGEQGVIDSFEQKVLSPCIANNYKTSCVGPLVPDAAFLEKNWTKHSIYICCYHDQGLIPFKMVHGQKGVHITGGLSFVRTSVDHGTAKDIFNLDKADASSMKMSIDLAVQLVKKNISLAY